MMKVEVLQENMVQALGLVSRFVTSKPSLPVLSHLLMETCPGGVMLTATNMENGVQMKVGAKVLGKGSVLVPAKLMNEYVNLLKPGTVVLEKVEGGVKVVAGAKKARFSGQSLDDFPDKPVFMEKSTIEIEAEQFSKFVRLVGFSASSEETRPVLSSMLFSFAKSGVLKVVATDGYRLSVVKKILVRGKTKTMKVLIPARVVLEVERIVKELGEQVVQMAFSNAQQSVSFVVAGVRVVTRLIDGDFPNYERILPKESEVVVGVDREELIEAVKTAAVFAREGSNIVKWSLGDGVLKVAANTSMLGDQESEVAADISGKSSEEIAFNSRFLLDFLSKITEGEVRFLMSGALQPGLFESKDANFSHVIMPVRTQGNG